MTSLRKRVTVGLVGAAVVAGGGIAYAATQSSDPRDAYLNDVAKRLNVTPEKLREAMKGASLDQLERAVKDGKLTQEQADAIKKNIEAGGGVGPFLGRPGFFGRGPELRRAPGPHFGFGFKALRGELNAVAKYLGLSVADLRKQLADGKSLADIAKAQNKDVDGLKKVITDEAKTHLDKAVKDGDLTQKQADEIAKELDEHIDDLVTLAPPRFRGFKGGPDFRGGPGLPVPAPGHGFRGGPGPRFGFGLGAFGADIDAVAKYLGLSPRELREQLADGKSLTDIAKAQNKDVGGLKKLLTDSIRKRFGDDAADKLSAHVDKLLELSLPNGLRLHP